MTWELSNTWNQINHGSGNDSPVQLTTALTCSISGEMRWIKNKKNKNMIFIMTTVSNHICETDFFHSVTFQEPQIETIKIRVQQWWLDVARLHRCVDISSHMSAWLLTDPQHVSRVLSPHLFIIGAFVMPHPYTRLIILIQQNMQFPSQRVSVTGRGIDRHMNLHVYSPSDCQQSHIWQTEEH